MSKTYPITTTPFEAYQEYLKEQISLKFPNYLSEHVENVANLALQNMKIRDGFLSDEFNIWTIYYDY